MAIIKAQSKVTQEVHDAIQLTDENIPECIDFLSEASFKAVNVDECSIKVSCALVGIQIAKKGDYIIKHTEEDYIVEAPEQFEKYYKLIED